MADFCSLSVSVLLNTANQTANKIAKVDVSFLLFFMQLKLSIELFIQFMKEHQGINGGIFSTRPSSACVNICNILGKDIHHLRISGL